MRLTRLEACLIVVLATTSVVGVARWTRGQDDHVEPRRPANERWPQVAAIVRAWATETGAYDAYLCTASFVAAGMVATAEHCVGEYEADDLLVFIDEPDLCAARPASFAGVREIRTSAGLATLVLDGHRGAGWFDTAAPPQAGRGVVLGWGAVNAGGRRPCNLVRSEPPLHSRDACAELMAAVDQTLAPHEFCAGDATGDACNGDSGGPLLAMDGDRPRLVGIVSRGPACLMSAWGGVYVDTSGIEDLLRDR
jgi:secreted trypsin-like serine protease